MKFQVMENLILKTGKGNIKLHKGQTVEVQPEKVTKLIESGKLQPLPYLDGETLIIPFDSPSRFHWWDRGQSIRTTLEELGASDEILKRYKSPYSDN
jgi:hypothetical protein